MNPDYLHFIEDSSLYFNDILEFTPIFSDEEIKNDEDIEQQEDDSVATVVREEVKRPNLYKVLLHNDDYTTMDFVVFVLQKFFLKTMEEAQKVMLEVHEKGMGVCGIYTHEVAESKVYKVLQTAKENGHPLRCTLEDE